MTRISEKAWNELSENVEDDAGVLGWSVDEVRAVKADRKIPHDVDFNPLVHFGDALQLIPSGVAFSIKPANDKRTSFAVLLGYSQMLVPPSRVVWATATLACRALAELSANIAALNAAGFNERG